MHSSCALCGDDKAKKESDITVQLTEEHREITRNLKRLNVESSANNSKIFSKLTDSLGGHFRKEEQLLFPRLTHALGRDVCDKLNSEHMEIMSAIQCLGGRNQEKASIERLEKMFLTHIATEENVLFWYLDVQQATANDHKIF